MVDTKKCTFCGTQIEPGTGKMLVKKDGTIQYFCSTKCQNNSKLGRIPRLTQWTAAGIAQKKLEKEHKK
ncbi:MAG TPA: 50S ribosomal protein L24e [Methanocella sp.]|uniref:50S ribosomal protein L24e n=1 Tax=Methanocella sp. TaxID=2052833 RepID=UPI002CDEC155|nr:50S ribosomal protein L24e [Methanocella sp.]HTY91530.1 50S ribosomal protein L24e [Methanocella sp.]